MRDLEIDELIGYLEMMKRSDCPENYNDPEARAGIARTLIKTGVIDDFMQLAEGCPDDTTATMSLWTTGFQMGRLFEVRFNEKKAMETDFPGAVKGNGVIN